MWGCVHAAGDGTKSDSKSGTAKKKKLSRGSLAKVSWKPFCWMGRAVAAADIPFLTLPAVDHHQQPTLSAFTTPQQPSSSSASLLSDLRVCSPPTRPDPNPNLTGGVRPSRRDPAAADGNNTSPTLSASSTVDGVDGEHSAEKERERATTAAAAEAEEEEEEEDQSDSETDEALPRRVVPPPPPLTLSSTLSTPTADAEKQAQFLPTSVLDALQRTLAQHRPPVDSSEGFTATGTTSLSELYVRRCQHGACALPAVNVGSSLCATHGGARGAFAVDHSAAAAADQGARAFPSLKRIPSL